MNIPFLDSALFSDWNNKLIKLNLSKPCITHGFFDNVEMHHVCIRQET